MKASSLVVLGTSSYAGKTVLVTGLCRILSNRGFSVAPFKAQNMSLNSFVTKNGMEISRAQALQAFASRVEPAVEMNPILLKPVGNRCSQVILEGRPYADMTTKEYYQFAPNKGFEVVKRNLDKLLEKYSVVIVEGAGSPAEINLRNVDITNMKVAGYLQSPVILVANAEWGGFPAYVKGTLDLLTQSEREHFKGIIVNKMPNLPGLREDVAQLRTMGIPILGTIPCVTGLVLPHEDSVSLTEAGSGKKGCVTVSVIKLPRISNFTDFQPLTTCPDVELRYISHPSQVVGSDVVILPGTKNTISDLRWLRKKRLDKKICVFASRGGIVLGICGGYQMLGKSISDPQGIESPEGHMSRGLGLLDIKTTFCSYTKLTRQVRAQLITDLCFTSHTGVATIEGYEIHMGRTEVGSDARSLFKVKDTLDNMMRTDGAVNPFGNVIGTYLHGIFDNPHFRESLLSYIRKGKGIRGTRSSTNIGDVFNKSIDRLAEIMERKLDLDLIFSMLDMGGR